MFKHPLAIFAPERHTPKNIYIYIHQKTVAPRAMSVRAWVGAISTQTINETLHRVSQGMKK